MTDGVSPAGPLQGSQIPRTPIIPNPNRNHLLRSGLEYQPVPTPERRRLNVGNSEVRGNNSLENPNIVRTNENNFENNLNNSSPNNSSLNINQNSNLQNPNALSERGGASNDLNIASNNLNTASSSSNSNLDNQASNNLHSRQNYFSNRNSGFNRNLFPNQNLNSDRHLNSNQTFNQNSNSNQHIAFNRNSFLNQNLNSSRNLYSHNALNQNIDSNQNAIRSQNSNFYSNLNPNLNSNSNLNSPSSNPIASNSLSSQPSRFNNLTLNQPSQSHVNPSQAASAFVTRDAFQAFQSQINQNFSAMMDMLCQIQLANSNQVLPNSHASISQPQNFQPEVHQHVLTNNTRALSFENDPRPRPNLFQNNPRPFSQQPNLPIYSDSYRPPLPQSEGAVFDNAEFKYHPFMKSNPEEWFAILEQKFEKRNVTLDSDKYYNVIKNLPQDVLTKVQYLLESLPDNDRYETVKRALIDKFVTKDDVKISNLFNSTGIGSMTPSEYLEFLTASGKNILNQEAI